MRLVLKVEGLRAVRLVRALTASSFRGVFLRQDGAIWWVPPSGLGDYTLERIRAFASGFLAAQYKRVRT